MRGCLTVDPTNRPSAGQLLNHKWLKLDDPMSQADPTTLDGKGVDLLAANPSCLVRKAVLGMMAVHRFQDHNSIGGQTPAEKEKYAKEVERRKQEAEQVWSKARYHADHCLGGCERGHRAVINEIAGMRPTPNPN